ncbi:MAG: efflux RND transporter periplasmic adaptor subunit [Pseudomonadota bacterium]
MRLGSILTAVIVAAALYMVIVERDTLLAVAGADAPAAPESAAAETADTLSPQDANAPVSVVVRRSAAQPVQNGLVLAGRTEADRKVEIRSETTGLVISEPILKGSTITAGDTLCQLDPGVSNAMLTEARARLQEAETIYTTAQRLMERGFNAETDAISKQAALEGAAAAVEQAEKEIDRLTITAPFDGILETNTADLGTLLQPGSACATLISLDPIHLVGFVPEQEIERLTIGSPAGARLITGQVVSGQVSFIGRSAEEVTRTFRVEVRVPNPDLSIRDGVSAEILVGLEGEEGHLLPQSSLTLNDEGRLGVRVNDGGVARFLPVDPIRDQPDGIWVSGLPPTAEIIVVGQDFVREGRPIEVAYEDDP